MFVELRFWERTEIRGQREEGGTYSSVDVGYRLYRNGEYLGYLTLNTYVQRDTEGRVVSSEHYVYRAPSSAENRTILLPMPVYVSRIRGERRIKWLHRAANDMLRYVQ